MKVLVTGATGFIGNYVVRELLNRNVTVIATSRNEEKARDADWWKEVTYLPFDLSAAPVADSLFEFFQQPESVIHLAWEGLPDYKSLFHFEENLPRHYAFLKQLIGGGCRNITVTGTCFEYGMKEGQLSEEMLPDPANPYGLAKYTLYKFLTELQKKEAFVMKWVRLFYMFGNGQNPRSLFSQLDRALENGDEIFNMSGGEQVRDFLPVESVAQYIVSIAMQNEVEGIINCCSGKGVKVKDAVMNYVAAKNKHIKLNLGYYPYPDYEPMSFWGDNKKLQKIINER